MPLFFRFTGAQMPVLHPLSHTAWESQPDESATASLEQGKILFFPQLHFHLSPQEIPLLSPQLGDGSAKNISLNIHTEVLRGARGAESEIRLLKTLLKRYAVHSARLLKSLIPDYARALQTGRTSLRTVEIEGRRAPSYKKDDTRLHVDAFPANPNQGKRILRMFCNIHPAGKPRVWRVGAPFEEVANHFLPHIPRQLPGSGHVLKTLKITKSLRTPYDHIMLNIHDRMKKNQDYQHTVPYTEIAFPAPGAWMVYTDQVSHAALSGQHVLEQTFYLPVSAMQDENRSPLRILEKMTGHKLALF
jgi:hypothetical protein